MHGGSSLVIKGSCDIYEADAMCWDCLPHGVQAIDILYIVLGTWSENAQQNVSRVFKVCCLY